MDEANRFLEMEPLLRSVATRFYFRANKAVPLDDAYQYGALGVLESIRNHGGQWAARCIWHSIIDGFRKENKCGTRTVDIRIADVDAVDPPCPDVWPKVNAAIAVGQVRESISGRGKSRKLRIFDSLLDEEQQSRIAKREGISQARINQIVREIGMRLQGAA